MAEAVFRHLVNEAGLSKEITVDSAGTAQWHSGKPPHEGTRSKLTEKNISYEGITARQVQQDDWDMFDYIITMDDQNMKDLENHYPKVEAPVLAKLMDYVKEPREVNVPDPYYTGDFDYTYDLVLQGSQQLLEYIRNKHNI